MCLSVSIFMSFTVFYCTSRIAFFLLLLLCLSVCVYVSCLCLWTMLPDLNKMIIMMMMMMMIKVQPLDIDSPRSKHCDGVSISQTGCWAQGQYWAGRILPRTTYPPIWPPMTSCSEMPHYSRVIRLYK